MLKQRIYLTLFFLVGIGGLSSAQQFPMTNGTINTCGGIFTDSGGATGNYGDNEALTYTICADESGGTHIKVAMAALALGDGDVMCCYDGDDATAPLLFCSDDGFDYGDLFYVQASASNFTGCLTFTFVSDGAGTDAGFSGDIECIPQCQLVNTIIASSDPVIAPPDTGYIDVCPGQVVTLQGSALYPENNVIYAQSNMTSTFEWSFGDGNIAYGPNVTHAYSEPGGYVIQLLVTDVQGCTSSNLISQRVRVSGPPDFDLLDDISSSVCTGDTIGIYTGVDASSGNISIQPGEEGFPTGGVTLDSICLPDGSGISYATTITLNQFSPGQVLTSVDDLLGICLDLEHSYMGDLEIDITCPGGQTVRLQDQGGSGRWLGYPIDYSGVNNACDPQYRGEALTYCWTPNAPSGVTWLTGPTTAYYDPISDTNGNTLDAGDYSSAEDLANLVGCPLNGDWTLTITDNLSADDGYVFSWTIELSEELFPSLETFDLEVVNLEWQPNASIITNTPDSLVAVPISAGLNSYVLEVTDNFGCMYDTTVVIDVLPPTDPSCSACLSSIQDIPDETICDDGETVQLDAVLLNDFPAAFQDAPSTIFNNANAPQSNPLLSTINVFGLPYATIGDNSIQSICINLATEVGFDVDVILVAPNGTTVPLTQGGNGQLTPGSGYTNTCFTPSAVTPINAGASPYTGEFAPIGNLGDLIGGPSEGIWTLQVIDANPSFSMNEFYDWTITFSNNTTWSWTPSGGLSCTDCPNPVASPATTTTYTVTSNDAFDCENTETVTVTVIDCSDPCNLTATQTGTDVTCIGANDGTASITATGATGSVTYVMDGTTTQVDDGDFSNLATGMHQVVLTDANGCTFTLDFTLSEPSPIMLTLGSVAENCSGSNDGSATVSASGGTPNYSYSWSGGFPDNTATIVGLAAGTYTVTVTDDHGCTATGETMVNSSSSMSIVESEVTDAACFGMNSGAISFTVTGGSGTFTYAWSDASLPDSNNVSGLAVGSYTVTIEDANNCPLVQTFTIDEPSMLDLLVDTLDVGCFGGSTGAAGVTPAGGTLPYTYQWDDPSASTDAAIFDLPPGIYNVTVTDNNGCVLTAGVEVSQPDVPLVMDSVVQTIISCNAEDQGQAVAYPSGGTMPYSFEWSGGAGTDDTLSAATPLTYIVTVTDAGLCTATGEVTLVEHDAMSVTLTSTDMVCFGEENATATVTNITGGTGIPDLSAYTYQWNNASDAAVSVGGLGAGTHIVTVTDVAGCTATASTTVGTPSQITTNNTITPVTCNGGADGSISATPSGGVPPYTYDWGNGTITDNNIGALAAGTYTFTITDSNDCTLEVTEDITEPEAMQLTKDSTTVGCFGDASGTASVTVAGGTAPYSYLWNDAASQTSNVASGLVAGLYTVIVTDANDCTVSTNVQITQPEGGLTVTSITQTVVGCFGANGSQAEVTVSGGSYPYTFLWDDPAAQTDSVLIGVGAGVYNFICEDVQGCIVTGQVTIVEYPEMELTIEGTDINCFGAADGTATVTAIVGGMGSGDLADYTFDWGGPAGNESVVGLAPGTYTVTATDASGCTGTASIDLAGPEELLVNSTVDSVACFGGSDGAISLVLSGGTLPYSFDWGNGLVTQSSSLGLAAGEYSVTIIDGNACVYVVTDTITEPPQLTPSITTVDVGCFGESTGEAMVTVTGGIPPYEYLWDDPAGQVVPDLTALPAGTYTVLVTDANDCTATASAVVNQPGEVLAIASLEEAHVGCAGSNESDILVTPTGGVPPYNYQWSNGDTDATLDDVAPGLYTVTVTDLSGCITTATASAFEHPAMVVEVSSTGLECYGASDATAAVNTILGGAGTGNLYSYTYQWSGSDQTGFTVDDLSAGQHVVTVTDLQGCTSTAEFMVTSPEELELFPVLSHVNCNSGVDGEISALVIGGIAPYTYNFGWGDTSESSISGLPAGTYTVIVTDSFGCSLVETVTLTEPDELVASASSYTTSCHGGVDGQAQVVTTGGMAPYTFEWSDGQDESIAEDLPQGTYTVTVTDANGCQAVDSVDVIAPSVDPIVITISQEAVGCNGGTASTATARAVGGTAGYFYEWDNGQLGQTLENVAPGNYTVTATDSEGCSTSASVSIVEYGTFSAQATSTDLSCSGANDGSATVTAVTGGAGTGNLEEYTYEWSGSDQTTGSIAGLSAGEYIVTVTDINGCTALDTVTVAAPEPLALSLQMSGLGCAGDQSGSVTVNVTGGNAPYAYQWDANAGGGTNSTATNLPAGAYSVTVTDANGCSGTAYASVNGVSSLGISVETEDNLCFGDSMGVMVVDVTGGTGDYQYTWSLNGETTTMNELDGLEAGDYSVTVSDANGCSATASATITEPDELTFATSVEDVTCNGDRDGSLLVAAQGGYSDAYTYSFNGEAFQGSEYLGGIGPGVYSVAVQDANGCIVTEQNIILEAPSAIGVDILPTDGEINILYGDTLTLTALDTAGVGTVTYTWTSSYNQNPLDCYNCPSPSLIGTENDDYSVIVTDESGCTDTKEVRVIVTKVRSVFVPSGFTPNGDGANDVLMVHGVSGSRVSKFRVYDRWGELVFSAYNYGINSTDPEVTWDGTFKGKAMNPGVYVWNVVLVHEDGRREEVQGNTNLLR